MEKILIGRHRKQRPIGDHHLDGYQDHHLDLDLGRQIFLPGVMYKLKAETWELFYLAFVHQLVHFEQLFAAKDSKYGFHDLFALSDFPFS